MNSRRTGGFALPTVLIASIVMLSVLLAAITSTVAVRVSLKSQYYNQLSQLAGDAGIAYAKACLSANDGVPRWGDGTAYTSGGPLMPDTNCNGTRLSSCPASPTDAACHFVSVNDGSPTIFTVNLPELGFNGKASNVTSVGSTNLLRSSDSSTWRTYSQSSKLVINDASPIPLPTLKVLVVAGGGGGGGAGAGAGGGGGGGVIYDPSFTVVNKSYEVSVGLGGNGLTNTTYSTTINNGNNSVFDSLTAIGGGGGSSGNVIGGSGGSGGGGNGGYATNSGSGTTGQGYAGGNGVYSNPNYSGGGGGGVSATGANGTTNVGGNGGTGLTNLISGFITVYGSGGGGGTYLAGTAGLGGDGAGNGGVNSGGNGTSGVANRGGGGGGGGGYNTASTGGTGGSGIVIVSY